MRKLLVMAFVAALSLSGCQTSPGQFHDKHTGVTVTHSRTYALKNGLLYNLNGFAGHSARRGFNLAIDYSSTGLGWMFFREAWSFGKQYEYVVADERVAGCGGGSCTLVERGGIRMSEDDFRKASQTGFEFKLMGKNGSVEGRMPAEAFQQVLDQLEGRQTTSEK